MSIIVITSATHLNDILEEANYNVVICFTAPSWCVPCQRLAPHFDAASEQLQSVTFVKVDIDELPEVSNEFGIMSVPTVLRFRPGQRETVSGRTVVTLVKELGE